MARDGGATRLALVRLINLKTWPVRAVAVAVAAASHARRVVVPGLSILRQRALALALAQERR